MTIPYPRIKDAGYNDVENALAHALGYPPSRLLALRARLRYLQRFLGPKAGKGRSIAYSEEDVLKWAVALCAQEHGADPQFSAWLVAHRWAEISNWARWAELDTGPGMTGGPVFLTFQLRLGSIAEDSERVARVGGFRRHVPQWVFRDGYQQLAESVVMPERLDPFIDPGTLGEGDTPGVLCIYSLTALITALRKHCSKARAEA